MTNEEALKELKYICMCESTDKGKEALTMAIKALEQQPSEVVECMNTSGGGRHEQT